MRAVSTDYAELKQAVVRLARDDIRRMKPLYVAEFQDVLRRTGSIEKASQSAAKYLGSSFPKWSPLLTAFFDLEFVRGKVIDCHALLRQQRDATGTDAGFWFSYHLDHWVFQTDAFMDRCDTLFKRTIRQVLRPLDPTGWQDVERAISVDLQLLKDRIANVRNPLAHGEGGGVSGIADQWESILAAPVNVFDDDFVKRSVGSLLETVTIQRRRRWFRAVHRSNLLILAYSEAFSGRLLREIRLKTST
jgi:hypothetical protein